MASTYKQVQEDSIADFKAGLKKLIVWGAVAVGFALVRELLNKIENSKAEGPEKEMPSPEVKGKSDRPRVQETVDFASDQSFPASDPPSWTQHH